MSESARIYKLTISRFRGIHHLEWLPAAGMNVLIGGGDAGKTTILDAVQLLLHPSNHVSLSESDYWERQHDDEFVIEAVIALPSSTEISHQTKFAWPWQWNGHNAVVPGVDGEAEEVAEPVYCIRATGTSDLELNWEVIQPNEETDSLPAGVRRRIGVVRLTNDANNDRDLRLVYGSALDRLVADQSLRGRVGRRLSEVDLQSDLRDESKTALGKLDETLKAEQLPHGLSLGLTSSQGLSVGALTGLLATRSDESQLPLASWGAGTRRMATLEIVKATQATTHITVIDEVERGLEPYRVRKLARSLMSDDAQGFVTTHSPIAVSAMVDARLWYLDAEGRVGELDHNQIASQQQRDPETFLAKFAVICEGVTEVGFLSTLLQYAIEGDYRDHGIHLANGQGNDATLGLLKALKAAGLSFGGFVDDEGKDQGKWDSLKETMGNRLFQWSQGCSEELVINAVSEEKLHLLACDDEGEFDGKRLRTLATRVGLDGKDFEQIKAECVRTGVTLRELIIGAATGSYPEDADRSKKKELQAHARDWFKSQSGGQELARRMFELSAWPQLHDTLIPHINAIREAVELPPVEDI